jgi:hypothetical protein
LRWLFAQQLLRRHGRPLRRQVRHLISRRLPHIAANNVHPLPYYYYHHVFSLSSSIEFLSM